MRFLQPKAGYIRQNEEWFGDMGFKMLDIPQQGVKASYTAADFRGPRTRGLPYKIRDSAETHLITEKCGRPFGIAECLLVPLRL